MSSRASALELIPESLRRPPNLPGGRTREMDRQHQRLPYPRTREKLPARLRCLFRVGAEARRPVRLAALQRVMHHVAEDDRLLPLRADVHATVIAACGRASVTEERVVERIALVDQQRLPAPPPPAYSSSATPGRIACGLPPRFVLLLPVRVFALVKDVFGVRKRRHPAAVDELRVPAGVIDMQVGAEHVVDVGELQAERMEAVEPGPLSGNPSARCSPCPRRCRCRSAPCACGVRTTKVWYGDDELFARRVVDKRVHLGEMLLRPREVGGREHLVDRPPRPVALNDVALTVTSPIRMGCMMPPMSLEHLLKPASKPCCLRGKVTEGRAPKRASAPPDSLRHTRPAP